jgi:hypothetical protein
MFSFHPDDKAMNAGGIRNLKPFCALNGKLISNDFDFLKEPELCLP